MADRAVGGESRRHMVRIRRAVKVSHMTCCTGCRRKVVVVIDVTLSALQCCVSSRQCEAGECRVVKGRRTPGGRGMASLTRLRESRSNMVGIRGAGEVLLMAPVAESRERGVISVHMARGTRNRDVRAGKRKRSLTVVKSGWRPCRCIVAGVAGQREADGLMVRIRGVVVIREMARRAIGGNRTVISIQVTL
jgi:hypothetical protein